MAIKTEKGEIDEIKNEDFMKVRGR